jgi:hypothetical protein
MEYHHLLHDIDEFHGGLENGGERTVEALVNSGWIAWTL